MIAWKPVVLDDHGLGVAPRHRGAEPLLAILQLHHLGGFKVLYGEAAHGLVDHWRHEEDVKGGSIAYRMAEQNCTSRLMRECLLGALVL